MYDYLVIGLGLAGIAFCETLEEHGKRFCVIDDERQGASGVAGGIYNPVVLKRLKLAYGADRQLPLVGPFYDRLQRKLGVKLHFPGPVLRRFASAEEQNQWFEAALSPELGPYLSKKNIHADHKGLAAPWGFAEVSGTGRVNTGVLLAAYSGYLLQGGNLLRGRFDYDRLEPRKGYFKYGTTKATNVVFATGAGLSDNPFFNYLPLQGNKGEYLEIHCSGLKLRNIVKASIFLIPLGEDRYSAGATYDWRDSSPAPTDNARNYLVKKLDSLLLTPYRITGQTAGIRPTVPDRRPLLGEHPELRGMYVLNGYGSRGVMIAPYAASQLFASIENNAALDPEMDIRRYGARYAKPGRWQKGHNG